MTTMPVTTSFPEFVPNQILTNTQLNALREYLDVQNRQTRVRLTGIGIICGLHASIDDAGDNPTITISHGYGVTSDGYIIEIPDTTYVARIDYLDPYREEYTLKNDPENEDEVGLDVYGPAYEPWRLEKDEIQQNVPSGLEGDPPNNPVTQIPIIELITQEVADENNDSRELRAIDFADHVLVLYLEIQKHDLKSCLTTDCNNKGQNLEFVVKALLIHEDELNPVEPCESWSNPAFIPRFHRALRQNGVGNLEDVFTSDDINQAYTRILEDVKGPLFQKIQEKYDQINPFLQLNEDMGAVQGDWNNALNGINYNQYHYDFVKDIACAYNEFLAHYCKIIDDCCPSLDFPRHLMIRDFEGQPEPYRHEFQPSPVRNVMHHDIQKAEILFRRILEMIRQFAWRPQEVIKITPSQTDRFALGEKSIPHYYQLQGNSNIKSLWQGEACCKDPSLLSYEENNMFSTDPNDNDISNQEYIEAPLEALIDKKSFFKIEGHLGQSCKLVLDEIHNLRKIHNLDFNIQVLNLGDQIDNPNQESPFISEIKLRLTKIDLLRNQIEQHYLSGNVDPAFIETLNTEIQKIWDEITDLHNKWLDERTNTPLSCDLTQIRADYLLIRSQVLCTYGKIKKVFGSIPDLRTGGHKTATMADVAANLNTVRARKTEIEANLESQELSQNKKAALEIELARVNASYAKLVNLDQLYKIGSKITYNFALKKEEIEVAEVEEVVISDGFKKTDIFTEGLKIGLINLKSDIDLLCELLPKDGLKFNYTLFIYYYKNVIAGLIQFKLLVSIYLESMFISISQNQALSNGASIYAMQLLSSRLVEFTDYLNAINGVQYNCLHAQLATSYYTFQHLLKHREYTFSEFAKRYPGMEHLTGVTRGDTFIVVCDTENNESIVADFTLSSPIGCCCDFDPDQVCLPPIAMPDYRVIYVNTEKEEGLEVPEIIDVLRNDLNLEGSGELILSLPSNKSVLNEQHGEADNLFIETDQNGKQQVRYVRTKMFPAIDSFKYQIIQKSNCKLIDEGEVIILIRPGTDKPIIAQNDIVATSEGQPINIDVVMNDLQIGVYALQIAQNPMRGSVSITTPDGQNRQFITYVPAQGFVGRDRFNYEVRDGNQTSRGSVTVLVVPCCHDESDNGPNVIDSGTKFLGLAKDEFGEPLIMGSSVILIGTSMGAITNAEGSFTLELPEGRQSVQFKSGNLTSQVFEMNIVNNIPSPRLDVIFRRGFSSPSGPSNLVNTLDLSLLADLVIPGEDDPADNPRVVLDTFSTRHNERIVSLEAIRLDPVIGSTDAFEEADKFLSETMLDAEKSVEDISSEYRKMTKSLVDAHKLSTGTSKKTYKELIEKTTQAFMDKMIIKDPNKAEPTMKAELEDSVTTIKAEGISVIGFKNRFKGNELKRKMKIGAISDINRILT